MVNGRKIFIKALCQCKFNKERIRNYIHASAFRGKKAYLVWKEVCRCQHSNRIKDNEKDGLTDNDNVASLFHDKLNAVSGSVNDDVPECKVFVVMLLYRLSSVVGILDVPLAN